MVNSTGPKSYRGNVAMRLRVKDVRLVVDYLYQDERRHFEESGRPRRHIFRVIERLRKCTGEIRGRITYA